MEKTYTCQACQWETEDRLKMYYVQVRGLRADSNKTTGKSFKSAMFCEPCALECMRLTSLPTAAQVAVVRGFEEPEE